MVKLSTDGQPAVAGEPAVSHDYTVQEVVDDHLLRISRPVKGDLQVQGMQYQVRRTVDTWKSPE